MGQAGVVMSRVTRQGPWDHRAPWTGPRLRKSYCAPLAADKSGRAAVASGHRHDGAEPQEAAAVLGVAVDLEEEAVTDGLAQLVDHLGGAVLHRDRTAGPLVVAAGRAHPVDRGAQHLARVQAELA